MSRYYVIDTTCAEYEQEVLLGYRGELLGIFEKLDSAWALAVQRVGAGSPKVVVIDSVKRKQAYPPAEPAAQPARDGRGRLGEGNG
jgi:hypothetical protein